MAPRKSVKRRAPSNASETSNGPKVPKVVRRTKSTRSVSKEKDSANIDAEDRLILRELTSGGIILTCGQGDIGQLGLGEDVLEKTRFSKIPEYQNIVAISAGGMHNICLTKDGKVLTFGCNDEGALGRDTSKEGSEAEPGFVQLPGPAIQVTAGDSHSAALLEDGQVFVWGSFRDSHGTLGLITEKNEKFPVKLPINKKVIKIASGADHLVLLDRERQVLTCGCGEQGQLGRLPERKVDRDTRQGISPLLVPAEVHFKVNKKVEPENIWAGTYCTFVKTANDIYVFGLNNYNQLGIKGTDKFYHPKISSNMSSKNLQHISSGQHHTIVLDDNGKVFVLGRKEYGRLGLGNVDVDATELTEVTGLSGVRCIDVAAGSAQSFAVSVEGTLYAWGMGSSGQLGTGEEEDVDVPELINSKQLKEVKIVRVSGGGQHTIVLAQPLLSTKEKSADRGSVKTQENNTNEIKNIKNDSKSEQKETNNTEAAKSENSNAALETSKAENVAVPNNEADDTNAAKVEKNDSETSDTTNLDEDVPMASSTNITEKDEEKMVED